LYLDGVKRANVDLYSPAVGGRHVVYSAMELNSAGTHTIEVRVLGTKHASATNSIVDVEWTAS